jgi:hypothetical protein
VVTPSSATARFPTLAESSRLDDFDPDDQTFSPPCGDLTRSNPRRSRKTKRLRERLPDGQERFFAARINQGRLPVLTLT